MYNLKIISYDKDSVTSNTVGELEYIESIEFKNSEIEDGYLNLYIDLMLYSSEGQITYSTWDVEDEFVCTGEYLYTLVVSIELNNVNKYLDEPFIITTKNSDLDIDEYDCILESADCVTGQYKDEESARQYLEEYGGAPGYKSWLDKLNLKVQLSK